MLAGLLAIPLNNHNFFSVVVVVLLKITLALHDAHRDEPHYNSVEPQLILSALQYVCGVVWVKYWVCVYASPSNVSRPWPYPCNTIIYSPVFIPFSICQHSTANHSRVFLPHQVLFTHYCKKGFFCQPCTRPIHKNTVSKSCSNSHQLQYMYKYLYSNRLHQTTPQPLGAPNPSDTDPH